MGVRQQRRTETKKADRTRTRVTLCILCCCSRIVSSVTPPGLTFRVTIYLPFSLSVSLRTCSFPIVSSRHVALSICASCFQLCSCVFLSCLRARVAHRRTPPSTFCSSSHRFSFSFVFCLFSCLLYHLVAPCRTSPVAGGPFRFFFVVCVTEPAVRELLQPLISQRGPTCPPPSPDSPSLCWHLCSSRGEQPPQVKRQAHLTHTVNPTPIGGKACERYLL